METLIEGGAGRSGGGVETTFRGGNGEMPFPGGVDDTLVIKDVERTVHSRQLGPLIGFSALEHLDVKLRGRSV